jgi:hypothetical protein
MRSNFLRPILSVAVLGCLLIVNLGCGDRVSGKYTGAQGAVTIDFESGKATVKTQMLGNTDTETMDYTVKDDTVTLKSSKLGELPLTINKDGSLSGGSFGTLTKAQ